MSLDAFLSGVVAGYGIAIPVGPIGILILELGLDRGFRVAFGAGAGAASADLIYATIAALAGTFLISTLSPIAPVLRIASAIALISLGAWLLYYGRNPSQNITNSRVQISSPPQTYAIFLGLTLLNPVTVTYFTTLILGMQADFSHSPMNAALFIMGAFLASLSWQTLLATISGLAHKRFPRRVAFATFAVGNLTIILFGVAILLGYRI